MITWSQPMPVLRSAMALACPSSMRNGVRARVENDEVVAEPVHLAEMYGACLCHGPRLYGICPGQSQSFQPAIGAEPCAALRPYA